MTEQQLRCGTWDDLYRFVMMQVSQRKVMLAQCACCRCGLDYVTLECNRKALEASERFADGLASLRELEDCWGDTRYEPFISNEWPTTLAGPADCPELSERLLPNSEQDKAARRAFVESYPHETIKSWLPNQIAFVLDVFGDVFHNATFPHTWRTDTAVALARQMYESREFSAMPILADALQDAGCDNEDILEHCRGDGPHVRGCWVVDLVLGKE